MTFRSLWIAINKCHERVTGEDTAMKRLTATDTNCMSEPRHGFAIHSLGFEQIRAISL